MGISQEQYAAARRAAAAGVVRRTGRIDVTSTLRDRTPAPEPKPLDEGQIKWGGPSDFNWGSRTNEVEAGPTVNTSYNFNWPDYGLEPDPDPDPDNPDEESEVLPAAIYEWKEVARTERTVRVTGSNGAYVDVNRMDEVLFQIPTAADGRSQYVHMIFKKV